MSGSTSAQASLEILEFANSQLLEYRLYDQRLDSELASIYAQMQKPRWYDKWVGSRYANAARQVQALGVQLVDADAFDLRLRGLLDSLINSEIRGVLSSVPLHAVLTDRRETLM